MGHSSTVLRSSPNNVQQSDTNSSMDNILLPLLRGFLCKHYFPDTKNVYLFRCETPHFPTLQNTKPHIQLIKAHSPSCMGGIETRAIIPLVLSGDTALTSHLRTHVFVFVFVTLNKRNSVVLSRTSRSY